MLKDHFQNFIVQEFEDLYLKINSTNGTLTPVQKYTLKNLRNLFISPNETISNLYLSTFVVHIQSLGVQDPLSFLYATTQKYKTLPYVDLNAIKAVKKFQHHIETDKPIFDGLF